MPFRPLPKTFIDDLNRRAAAAEPVVELGGGAGDFAALLAACGVAPCVLDRHGAGLPAGGVVGDARQAPFRPGSLGLVVAANLVRHLTPRRRLGEWIAAWRRLLKPGGRLYVFEDEPGTATPSQRNFRDLQEILARLMPESRGPLLARDRFRDLVAAEVPAAAWTWGRQANGTTIDAGAVMRMLRSGQGTEDGPMAGLIRRIGRDGIAPGSYWWGAVGVADDDPGGGEA